MDIPQTASPRSSYFNVNDSSDAPSTPVEFRSTASSLGSRRASIAPLFLDLPGTDTAQLEAIHASSVANPGLTTFGLGSPTPAASESLPFNRFYSRVKSVAQGVKESLREAVVVGGGSTVASALSLSVSQRSEVPERISSSPVNEDFATPTSTTRRKLFGGAAQPFYQRHHRSTSSNVSLTSASSTAERSSVKRGHAYGPTSNPTSKPTSPGPASAVKYWGHDGSLDNLAMMESRPWDPIGAASNPSVYDTGSTTGVIQFPGTDFGDERSIGPSLRPRSEERREDEEGEYDMDDMDDYENDSSADEEGDGDASEDDGVLLSSQLPPGEGSGLKTETVNAGWAGASDNPEHRLMLDLPTPSTMGSGSLKSPPVIVANEPAQAQLATQLMPTEVEGIEGTSPKKRTKTNTRPRRPKPVSRLSENHLLPGFAVVHDSDDSDSSPTNTSVAATTTAGDQYGSSSFDKERRREEDIALRTDGSGTMGFTSWFRGGKAIRSGPGSVQDAGAGGAVSRNVGIGVGTGAKTNSEAVTSALRNLRSGNLGSLSKEFWMKDENCKECFLCNSTFTAWRRRHHCRICGQIFCAKCTTHIPGEKLGYSGSMRVCTSCLKLVNEYEDDSSADEYAASIVQATENGDLDVEQLVQQQSQETAAGFSMAREKKPAAVPSMVIPASRTLAGNPNRRSAILEIGDISSLQRPSSAHSTSLNLQLSRPLTAQSSKHLHAHHGHSHHHRHASRSYHRWATMPNDRNNPAPFHRNQDMFGKGRKHKNMFQHDSIIDPELAPYLSDPEMSDEEPASIFSTIAPRFVDSSGKPIVAPSTSSNNDGKTVTVAFGPERTPKRARSRSRNLRNGGGSIGSTLTLSLSSSALDAVANKGISGGAKTRRRNTSFATNPHARPPTRGRNHRLGIRPASTPNTESPRLVLPLNAPSTKHIRDMLMQLLRDADIPKVEAWRDVLYPILVKVTDEVVLNVKEGDDMNIRNYVKIKRIPGGLVRHTSYVSGIVFSKNIAHKQMATSIDSPNILVVTFPIEYSRGSQFMSLEPIISQEKEFLQNLVNRIAVLKPSLLLAQHNISGLALNFLKDAGIATEYNVKPSVIEAVSRCTQADIYSSVDKLVMNYHLGKCERFEITTYKSADIPGGKKTYTYLSGCRKDLGCTIVLRGENYETLKKIKHITELMVYVVYSLKLESSLMMDEFVAIPSITPSVAPHNFSTSLNANTQRPFTPDTQAASPPVVADGVNTETGGANGTSLNSDSPNNNTASSSITEHSMAAPTYYEGMVQKYETKILSSSPFVKYMQPYLLARAREFERRLIELRRLRDRDMQVKKALEQRDPEKIELKEFYLVLPEMLEGELRDTNPKILEVLLAIHDAEYDKAYHLYQTQKRQWEAYVSQYGDLFDPFQHQSIVVLYSLVCTNTGMPCLGPDLSRMYYYHQYAGWPDNASDCTLGQYVETLAVTANEPCAANYCNNDMLHHHRSYVHGQSRISVLVVDNIECPIKGMENRILMWSYCKICPNKNTPVCVMSDGTWKYSFAKYLELSFWSKDMKVRAGICQHDLHRDYVRCFAHDGLTIMFQYDPVDLYEIVVPRTKITYKPELDLQMKNDIYLQYEERIKLFYASIKNRLDAIKLDGVVPERVDTCQTEIERLRLLSDENLDNTIKQLQRVYSESLYYEIVPLNQVLRDLQQKVMFWEDAFNTFEKDFWPSEKDLRRLASQQLRKIFVDRDASVTSLTTEDNFDEKEAPSKAASYHGEAPTPEPESPAEAKKNAPEEAGVSDKPELGPYLEVKEVKDLATASAPVVGSVGTSDLATTPVTNETSAPLLALTPMTPPDLSRATSAATVSTVSTMSTVNTVNTDTTETQLAHSTMPSLKTEPSVQSLHSIPEAPSTDSPEDSLSRPDELLTRTSSRTSRSSFDTQRALPPSGIPRPVDPSRRIVPPSSFSRNTSSRSMASVQSAPPNRSDTNMTSASGRSTHTINVKKLAESIRGKAEKFKGDKKISERLKNSFQSSSKKREERSSIPLPRPAAPTSLALKTPRMSKVSTLTKHFEQISREFEKERRAKQREARQSRVFPIVASKPIVEVFRNAQEAAADDSDEEAIEIEPEVPTLEPDSSNLTKSVESQDALDESVEDLAAKSDKSKGKEVEVEEGPKNEPVEAESGTAVDYASDGELGPDNDAATLPSISDILEHSLEGSLESKLDGGITGAEARMEIPKHERTSLMSLLTKFWAEKSSSGWPVLEYPLSALEHVFSDSDVIVREDEPSSLIAFTLSSTSYRSHFKQKLEPETGAAPGSDLEQSLLNATATHLKYQFSDGNAKMFCKVFYAEHFDALRRKCGLADRYVESLSRCIKWDTKGGKSKSVFLRSLDDRIIIKALQPVETAAFLKFANSYFQFMSEAFFHELPTVIAKMLGFYQINIKNPVTGTDIKWDVLVMENLFYDRKTTRRFDLKGSMRNRKAQATGERDEVLLDENMVEFIFESPLFVREHSKKLLRVSLWNDTLFLAKHNVMDYSLMIGFDEDRKELIVGIIDCIRTYTWDKKMETMVKGAIGNSASKRPTVITPREYKTRFREAMERYILEAPNCWHLFRMNFMQAKDDKHQADKTSLQNSLIIPPPNEIMYIQKDQEPVMETVEGEVAEKVDENQRQTAS